MEKTGKYRFKVIHKEDYIKVKLQVKVRRVTLDIQCKDVLRWKSIRSKNVERKEQITGAKIKLKEQERGSLEREKHSYISDEFTLNQQEG